MAAGRTPGPYCANNNPQQVDDGTMCRVPSPAPAPVGAREDSAGAGFQERLRYLLTAYRLAIPLAPAAVYKETGYQLGSLISGLLPGLLEMLVALGATTAVGAGIGAIIGFFAGGVGAIPGAAVGADVGFDAGMAILTWLGVGFLLKSMGAGLVEVSTLVSGASQRAWRAGQEPSGRRNAEIQRAANDLAKAVGVLIRLLLQGIVAYLLKNAAVASSRSAVATGQAVRSAGSEVVADQTVAELVGKLRASKLGDGFATWVEKNWRDLVKDPRFRPRASEGGGGAAPPTTLNKSAAAPPAAKSAPAVEAPETSTLAAIEINGLKADRILVGDSQKVAVIGRSMPDVRSYAAGLADQGYNVEIFDKDVISKSAQRQWQELTQDGKRVSDDELPATEMFKENSAWAQKLLNDGYTVVDIDNPRGLSTSLFYSMEQSTIFGGAK